MKWRNTLDSSSSSRNRHLRLNDVGKLLVWSNHQPRQHILFPLRLRNHLGGVVLLPTDKQSCLRLFLWWQYIALKFPSVTAVFGRTPIHTSLFSQATDSTHMLPPCYWIAITFGRSKVNLVGTRYPELILPDPYNKSWSCRESICLIDH